MISYHFTAKEHGSGRLVKGTVQADGQSSAVKLLGEKNLLVIELKEQEEGLFGVKNLKIFNNVKSKEKVIFTRQLATLVKAGLPITQALNTAVAQVEGKTFKAILGEIKTDVEGGSSLTDAFGKHPDVFNNTYVSLLNAGEQSGTLDKTLERLADQMENEAIIRRRIRGAMIYPAIVLGVIILVVVFMLLTVVPQIQALYKDLGQALPFSTKILVGVASLIKSFWWLLILVIIAAIFGLRAYIRTPKGRWQLDSFKLNVPMFKTLLNKLYMARLTRTLGVLVTSGVPILEALNIVSDAVNNVVIDKVIEEAAVGVKGGKSLSSELAKSSHILPLVPQMIKIGEDSGTLGDMLDKVAVFYEDEVDQAIKNLSTLIEPVMMVVLGVIVAFIIVAVLFPVYNLTGSGVNNIGTVNNNSSNSVK